LLKILGIKDLLVVELFISMRILILGACDTEKSSLSRRLGEKFEIPVVSSDEVVFDEFWKGRGMDDKERKLDFFKKNDSWVFGGVGARRILEKRGLVFDYLILLDYPKRVVLGQIFKRFRDGWIEGSVYGKVRGFVYLLFYLLFYSSKRSLRFAKLKQDEGVGVFVVRGDEDVDRIWSLLES
jgi:hypothetical protein